MKNNLRPLVSIIVPVYNLEQYIEPFIKSIKDQTYCYIEAVIINDGSTDNSLEVINNHIGGDDRFTVISTENQGASHARNTGIKRSKGQYITFLDADDFLMHEAIERMVSAITEGYDVACCNIKRICPTYETTMISSKTAKMKGTEFLEAIICHKIVVTNCAKLYKRELFEHITFHTLRLGEDSLLNMQIGSLLPKVRFIDYTGYGYIQRSGSSNHTPFDLNYMERYSKIVEQELLKHNETLQGRAEFLALLNKIRWYRVYANKSRHQWIGDSDFAMNINKLRSKYRAELKPYNLHWTLLFLSIYSYKSMHPLIVIILTITRWSNSIKRRI